MKFLYPNFNNTTHRLVGNNIPSSDTYPTGPAFNDKRDHLLSEGLAICVIEESLGYNCEWSQVLVIDPLFQNTGLAETPIYVRNINLHSVGAKKSFVLDPTSADTIKPNSPSIDPNLKEIFTPYVDYKNGLYSVRIQTDYEKALESFLLENLLNDVYYEGIQILLDSKGYKSDNATINNLINTYYTFAYINDDLDTTVTRRCEPLTFTVSIPLRFFSQLQTTPEVETSAGKITKTLTIDNKTLKDDINKVLRSLSSRSGDIIQLTYPNYFIKNFILDFEIAAIKRFANVANEIFAIAGFPLQSEDLIEYDLGFDDDLSLQGISAFKGGKEYKLNNAILAQARLRAEFNSKRIFNYLFLKDDMQRDAQNMEILEYLEKYVAYEKIELIDEPIYVNGKQISPEKARQYNAVFSDAQEQCLGSQFLKGTANDAITAVFSDPIYHLFVKTKKDESSQQAPKKGVFGSLKDSWTNLESDFKIIAKSKNPDVEYKVALSEMGSGFKEALFDTSKFKANTNTLLYVLNRLNINKILFEKIFCILKGVDPNDPNNAEIARLIAGLPQDIINYFTYYDTIRDLKGAEFAKALVNGLPLDSKLLCTKNADIIYFLKGLSTILKTYNLLGSIRTTISDAAKQAIESSAPRKESPYTGFGKAIGNSLQQALIDSLFDIVKNMLLENCEDPTLNQATNYQSPYDTHNPTSGMDRKQETNSDKPVLNDNRTNALTKIYDPLQYGFDREYAVDLLDLLFNDINCILTPQESIDLLSGTPSELVISLVKNIIIRKYSKPDNDLTFLLKDSNKLLLFFRELGLTVDQYTLKQIGTAVYNTASPATVCSPQQQKVREEIINGKIPKDLGVLERQLRTRSLKAKELFDKVVDGVVPLDVKPFCPDEKSAEYDDAVNHLKQNYSDTIDQTFIGTLTSFNSEAENLIKSIGTKKVFLRKDSNGATFDSVEYTLYHEDLAKNLLQPETEMSQQADTSTLKMKFLPKSMSEVSSKDVVDATLGASEEEQTVTVVCLDQNKEPDLRHELYQRFITNDPADTGFFIRFINPVSDIFSGNIFEGSDLQEIYKDTGGVLSGELRKRDYFIAVEADREILGGNEININLIYNDRANNRFVILKNINFEGQITDNYSSQGLSNEFDNITSDGLIYKKNAQDVYFITSGFFNRLPRRAINLLTAAYDQYFKVFFDRLELLKKLQKNIEMFDRNGIFSIDTSFSSSVKKDVYATTFDDKLQSNRKLLFSLQQMEKNDGYQENIELFNKVLYNNFVKPEQDEYYFKYNWSADADLLRIDDKGNFAPLSSYATAWYSSWGAAFDDEGTKAALENKDIKLVENTDPTKNKYLNSYAKMSLYHFKKSMNYKNCNINPHYLNFDFFKNIEMNSFTDELCKKGPDATFALEKIIVNLIFRTFITDLLIKSIPYWQTGTEEQFKQIYKQPEYIDILKEFFKLEMRKYNPYPPGEKDDFLHESFLKIAGVVYDDIKNKPSDLITASDDKNKVVLEYFIRREMKHFIDYSLYFNIIRFSQKTFVEYFKSGSDRGKKQYVDLASYNGTDYEITIYEDAKQIVLYHPADNSYDTLYEFKYLKYLESEYKYGLIFFLMAANVKSEIAEQFTNTRSELINLLSRYISANDIDNQNELSQAFNENKVDTNRLNTFLNNLAYSPTPAAMISLNPQYSKYIKFFLQAAFDSSRAFALSTAQSVDPNIKLTRLLNQISTTTGILSWSMIDQKTRQSLILNSKDITSLLFYKRLEDGRSITPDLVTSLLLTGGSLGALSPTVAGWTYLALDSINEAQYYTNSLEEIRKLKGLKGNQDPCEAPNNALGDGTAADPTCTIDKQEKLKKEINSFEPEDSK
jgi:hypothetical protein